MKTEMLPTRYAPPERASQQTLDGQIERLARESFLQTIADAVPVIVLVLNAQRQVVFANQHLYKFRENLKARSPDGKRPGELFGCTHSNETKGGCGTTEFCRKCGAVNAILSSQKGLQAIDECRILTKDNTALDFRVWATPLRQNGEMLTIFALLDISDEKRRQALERVFFHDIMNTAGILSGFSDLLSVEKDPEEIAEIAALLVRASKRLIEEIQAQRLLSSAERGDLELNLTKIDTVDVLREVANTYAGHETANSRSIDLAEHASACVITSDATLLCRVLGNMVKNALEATSPGGSILLSCADQHDSVIFSVKNQSVMDPDVQLQVFQRSFSTKGAGRGIGSFSIKLLGEKYLDGQVWFESHEADGTTFFLRLPKRIVNDMSRIDPRKQSRPKGPGLR